MRSALIAIFAVVVLGFAIGVLLPERSACTMMGCPCVRDGERLCNSCGTDDPLFELGIVQVQRSCPTREVLMCQGGQQAGVRYEPTGDCSYRVSILGKILWQSRQQVGNP